MRNTSFSRLALSVAFGFVAASAISQPCPPTPMGLKLHAEFADPSVHTVYRQGIWAIWYNPNFVPEHEAKFVATSLDNVRCDGLTEYGLKEPPNVAAQRLVNIYIFDDQGRDGFDKDWGNGVGSDDDENVHMTLPIGAHLDAANIAHEGFHVYQFNSNSPGFAYEGDTGWFIEATANWYAVEKFPRAEDSYATIGSIAGNPHLALWHGFDNAQPGDPIHWMTETRQYGLHLFLRHLINTQELPEDVLTSGFVAGTKKSPQNYIASQIGYERMAEGWADFAAHLVASYALGDGSPIPEWELSAQHREFAFDERRYLVADDPIQGIENDIAATLDVASQLGEWVSPPVRLRPRPWAYNAVRLKSLTGQHTFDIEATRGSKIRARLVILRTGKWRIKAISAGEEINLDGANAAYLVLATTPETYLGHHAYDYRLRLR